MPDKPLTVLTYAASASLAAVAFVYFFNPNFVIDGASSGSTKAKRTGIVGLVNTANDCFTNSSLQALAGLGDLRLFLIRELHRRKLSDPDVYRSLPAEENGKPVNRKKLLGLQSGDVTQALKTILDQLNERPLKKKTISARPFILTLERAFETRISREQQDAQELLQIIAERICDEYHAGEAARKRARAEIRRKSSAATAATGLGMTIEDKSDLLELPLPDAEPSVEEDEDKGLDEEVGFPMEGQTESQITCSHCQFVPKSSPVSFVMLTLSVPQKNSATLNECFDAHFKREIIEDYKCDRCRLDHAIAVYEKEYSRISSSACRDIIREKIKKLKDALAIDPEKPPEDVALPDSKTAPTRRIERVVKITRFPQILVIHLSRSIYNVSSSSAKNTAKVSFPERLPLGGLLDRRNYKLLGMIAHKGTHNSGHYECFRRQHVYAPYSRPHVDPETGPYSIAHTPRESVSFSPRIPAAKSPAVSIIRQMEEAADRASTATSSSPSIISGHESSASTGASTISVRTIPSPSPRTQPLPQASLKKPQEEDPSDEKVAKEITSFHQASIANATTEPKVIVSNTIPEHKPKKKIEDRWWRISDDKVKECRTHDVLNMQREVYMLFYEMERVHPVS
ncbi:MAG: hypothetical protein GOMPHAMPRED_003469 [Gomphillus americanus]|uniref:USP domain-containing protein n=1 Tax=Gomphillus americanus TaxID=1940652 RepID=A0A8H3IS07_9LECA|nr:MAG: hypothetical protein GOMPHAMPRED_003469 [Gomphillus americanus]